MIFLYLLVNPWLPLLLSKFPPNSTVVVVARPTHQRAPPCLRLQVGVCTTARRRRPPRPLRPPSPSLLQPRARLWPPPHPRSSFVPRAFPVRTLRDVELLVPSWRSSLAFLRPESPPRRGSCKLSHGNYWKSWWCTRTQGMHLARSLTQGDYRTLMEAGE